MTFTETRNRKIGHLIESSVIDFCKLFGTAYKKDEKFIYVLDNEGKPDFFLFAEYNENGFQIGLNNVVYNNLLLSTTMKLREVCGTENILKFLSNNKMSLEFLEDKHLLAKYGFEWNYKNYALLKSKLLIEIYNQLLNVSEIRLRLNEILENKAVIGAC
jgi:hypothetical protein